MPYDSYVKRHYDPTVKQLKTTLDLARETGASDQVIEAIEKSLKLSQQRDEFMGYTTSTQSNTCVKITNETLNHDWQNVFDEKKSTTFLEPIMLSGHVEGQFLKSILSAQRAKRVLDIGMYTGYSATSIAEALPADGKVVTLEVEDYLKGLVESLIEDSPHKNKISIVLGDALKLMTMMKDNGESFDAIFMDGAKEDYIEYLRLCLEGHLLAPGGTLVVDNAFFFGEGYTEPESNSAKFAKVIKSNPDLHVVLVPLRDGIYLIRRREDVEGSVA